MDFLNRLCSSTELAEDESWLSRAYATVLGFTCLLCAGLDRIALAITDGVASFSDQETLQCGSELLWKFVQLNWTGPNEENFVHHRAKATLVRLVFATILLVGNEACGTGMQERWNRCCLKEVQYDGEVCLPFC